MKNTFSSKPAGFSLVELLVVTAIIAILASLLLPTLAKMKSRTKWIDEIHSAKQILLASHLYADDSADRVLPGYRYNFSAFDRLGHSLPHPINARYPWRLAPYLAQNFEILYAQQNRNRLKAFAELGESYYTYAASVFPSLGANSVFVGGDDLLLPPNPQTFSQYGPFCVLKRSDSHSPANLITFVSARSRYEGGTIGGYYRTEPPYLTRRHWELQWNENLPPEQFGFVHPRFQSKAITAQLDGHAESLGMDKLSDMQRWSNQATRPSWTLTKSQ